MKKEYKIVAAGCLWGFMEGNAKFIEDSVKEQLKLRYDVEPEVVRIHTSQPYTETGDEWTAHLAYPVITLSMRIDGVSWSITRDSQSEADRGKIREKTDPNWKPLWDCVSYEDGENIKQLIEEEKL
jgi:hypothetical protein